ncbi:NAD(+)/NADH kinase [Dethiobacter alkaliphilus]|uniref:NAD kinase n=1 Tax=Dethiobacter alkaliphilus AHT 1 TaxID=555088 RepID=C0GE19_DETAL|nr:NAD(+)/NADH kinase [Dethiobacter alkaliphilus]EEG78313.1 ATP-NAD/AcoX kinase [Dethiobacter alkaliphilus AHT 1]
MKGIGIVPNWKKRREVEAIITRIVTFCQQRNIQLFLPQSDELVAQEGVEVLPLESFVGKADVVIVLGGDGTILRVARQFSGSHLPILGVNLGQMGFMAEVEPPMLETSLQKLLDGHYKVRHRLMLSCRVFRQDRPVAEYTALNDVVISKGPFSRIVYADTYVNDKHLETYPSDGLIVSTPTGSTGYSLSAGGPIVNPALDVMIITPICPHLLHHRSVIVSSSERVSIRTLTRKDEVILTVDGQVGFSLQDEDVVHVTRAPLTTPIIQLQGSDFYTLMHSKLNKVIQREPERV